MRRLLILLVFLIVSTSSRAANTEAAYGDDAMISSRSLLASQAGIAIMRRGGNAVDGAVATAFALAVTYPSAGNIGGGGFAVIRFPDRSVVTLDHREKAPLAAHRDMFLDSDGNVITGLSRTTHLASGVPGSVDGLIAMLERYGTKSLQEVIQPAIRLAGRGFIVDEYLARHIRTVGRGLQDNPAAAQKFSIKGKPIVAGDRWKQPDLANTLRLIQKSGRKGFYEGEVAALIVAEMQRGDGVMTLQDLKEYQSVWRSAVHTNYRDHDVYTMGPPSSAVLVLQMLNMLEPFDIAAMGWGSSQLIHHVIEAERRAYADRAEHLGDPDFHDVPLKTLASKEYAQMRFADFSPHKASDSEAIFAGVMPPDESRETTHFSVIDKSGMAVAFTTTLNSPYGNKIVVPGTGILLNNEMDDFSVKPDTRNQFDLIGRDANAIAPGKRMLSSMSPTIVTRGDEFILVTGSPGGSTIITTTLQIIMNVIDHKMSLEEAVGAPRFHHQWQPDRVIYERFAIHPDALENLKAKGHRNFTQFSWGRGIGDANTVMLKNGRLHGVEDPRTKGGAVGF